MLSLAPACPRPVPKGKGIALALLLLWGLTAVPAWSATTLSAAKGAVEWARQGQLWGPANQGQPLSSGDKVRTGPGGQAEITFEDGSKVSLAPRSDFTLGASDPSKVDVSLAVGTLKSWVKRGTMRDFKVRTPTAVCAVRGTEFLVSFDAETLKTQIDLFKGLLQVEDNKGNALLLQEGQRLLVDPAGMGTPGQLSEALRQEKETREAAVKGEVGLAMSKEAVLAAAAEEIKLSEYQQGKALVDVFGNRVRLEEYILRPAPDQFKLVVLNERADRFDYFFYHGTFNTALPTDLSVALRQLPGTPDAAPQWYLTGYRTGRSNTVDSVVEKAYGGHPVDLNNNGVPSDNVSSYYDSATDSFVDLAAGRPFFKTLFDYYRIWYNPADPANPKEPTSLDLFPTGLTYSWDPASGVTPFNGTAGTGAQNMDAHLATSYLGGSVNYALEITLPDGSFLHHRIKESYGSTGDIFTQYDNYVIGDDGSMAGLSDFSGATSGASYKESLLRWNFQQVITSSFFGGRKIDLVVEPKILVQSGLSGFSQ